MLTHSMNFGSYLSFAAHNERPDRRLVLSYVFTDLKRYDHAYTCESSIAIGNNQTAVLPGMSPDCQCVVVHAFIHPVCSVISASVSVWTDLQIGV